MRKVKVLIFLLIIGFAAMGFAAEKNYKAVLSGKEVSPAVVTPAKGEASFALGKDNKELMYKLTVSDIENVTAVHIHAGKPGQNGPPIALIDIKGKKAGKFSGVLAEGRITSKELLGPLKGRKFKDLVKEIDAGGAYVNVHTDKFPDGELRGQIK